MLDLSAAFDTVNHQILLSTLLRKGISGTALQWFDFTSQIGPSKYLERWGIQVARSSYRGCHRAQLLDHFSFLSHGFTGSVVHKHGFSYHCYADDTQLYFSFHPDDLTIAVRISACLVDISSWMKDHHLQLNLAKTELLVVSANPSVHHNFTFQLGSSTIAP